MAHYAFLNNSNVVTEVITGIDEDEMIEGQTPEVWYGEFRGQACRRTSYNTHGGIHYDPKTGEPSADQSEAFRFNYAGIGYTFNPLIGNDGAFVPPQPFPSWLLDETTALWVPPVPYPDAETCPCGAMWDEDDLAWVCVDCPE